MHKRKATQDIATSRKQAVKQHTESRTFSSASTEQPHGSAGKGACGKAEHDGKSIHSNLEATKEMQWSRQQRRRLKIDDCLLHAEAEECSQSSMPAPAEMASPSGHLGSCVLPGFADAEEAASHKASEPVTMNCKIGERCQSKQHFKHDARGSIGGGGIGCSA